MSDKRVSIKVSEDHEKFINKFAKTRGLELSEAIDRVLTTAETRINALNKYAGKTVKPKKAKKAAKAKAKAKAVKAKAKPAKKAAKKVKKAAKPAKKAASAKVKMTNSSPSTSNVESAAPASDSAE